MGDRKTSVAKDLLPFVWAEFEDNFAPVAGDTVFNKIVVYHRDGSPAEFFEPDDAGWDLAATACNAWDTMVSPPGVFTAVHTTPNQIAYLGMGNTPSTVHLAKLTLGYSVYVRDVAVTISANDANFQQGLVGPATGQCSLNTIKITVSQLGAGDVYGLVDAGGILVARGCFISANAASGNAHGAHVAAGGTIMVKQCDLEGISASGAGYGGYASDGTIYAYGGRAYGSTHRFFTE